MIADTDEDEDEDDDGDRHRTVRSEQREDLHDILERAREEELQELSQRTVAEQPVGDFGG